MNTCTPYKIPTMLQNKYYWTQCDQNKMYYLTNSQPVARTLQTSILPTFIVINIKKLIFFMIDCALNILLILDFRLCVQLLGPKWCIVYFFLSGTLTTYIYKSCFLKWLKSLNWKTLQPINKPFSYKENICNACQRFFWNLNNFCFFKGKKTILD